MKTRDDQKPRGIVPVYGSYQPINKMIYRSELTQEELAPILIGYKNRLIRLAQGEDHFIGHLCDVLYECPTDCHAHPDNREKIMYAAQRVAEKLGINWQNVEIYDPLNLKTEEDRLRFALDSEQVLQFNSTQRGLLYCPELTVKTHTNQVTTKQVEPTPSQSWGLFSKKSAIATVTAVAALGIGALAVNLNK